MYTPANNRVEDRDQRIAFMREYNFAALVTGGVETGLRATHLPVAVIDDGEGLRLSAHMAKANPQWQDFAGAREVMVIFSGPHAYVSPSLYARKPSLPTWDYLAIHAYGTVRRLDEAGDKLQTLNHLIDLHDPAFQPDFAALPPEYLNAKLAGIIAFEIVVTRLEARFKLSQERSTAERSNIVAALSASDDALAQELALKISSHGQAST